MYTNNIVNVQEFTTILNACTKKSGNLLKAPGNHLHIMSLLNDILFTLSHVQIFYHYQKSLFMNRKKKYFNKENHRSSERRCSRRYFGLARNQDDLSYSPRGLLYGHQKLGKLPNPVSLAEQRRPVPFFNSSSSSSMDT